MIRFSRLCLSLLAAWMSSLCWSQYSLRNANIEMGLDLSNGITVTSIRDVRTNHEYLSYPTFLFETSVDGSVWQSNNGIEVDQVNNIGTEYVLVQSHCPDADLYFLTEFILTPGDIAVHVKNTVVNPTLFPMFVRMVFPKLHGLKTVGNPADTMAAIPQEVGTVVPLQVAPPGASMASVQRNSLLTNAYFVGNDGGIWRVFEYADQAWSKPLRIGPPHTAVPGGSLCTSLAADGREDIWFVGYDGALYTLTQLNEGGWSLAKATLDGQTIAGAGVTALANTDNTVDVFFIGHAGGIKRVVLNNDRTFSAVQSVTSASVAPAGGQLSSVVQAFGQKRVVTFGNTGRLVSATQNGANWTWEYALPLGTGVAGGGLAIANHINNSSEVVFVGVDGKLKHATWINQVWLGAQLFPGPDVFEPGARVSAKQRNSAQLDAFVVGYDGALWTAWIYGVNGNPPLPITGPSLAPVGADVTAVLQSPTQEDALLVGHSGTPWLSFETNDGPWNPAVPLETTIGMPLNLDRGLPTAMNSMEVATVYDAESGAGLFFACLGGNLDSYSSPLQFTASSTTLAAFWTSWISDQGYVTMPTLAIGVSTEDDWHTGVGYYASYNKPTWTYPAVPTWLKESGAIYSHSGAGGGGILMSFPPISLYDHITSHSLSDLDQLLDEAQLFGTDVVYLWDYWQGESESGRAAYFNKGDYWIRQDMGGPAAFRAGIDKIHARGGKVVCYLESFIIYAYSQIGRAQGENWGARRSNGGLDATYEDCFTMTGALPDWQNYLAAKALELVRDYDVDGIFLDSAGWQMNRSVYDVFGILQFDALTYSKGILDLTRKVREAVQSIKPDFAVVLGETGSGQMNQAWDGGLSADLSRVFPWMLEANQARIVSSPVRFGNPERVWWTNGEDLNGLNQMFAAGHNLILCNAGPASPPSFMKDEAPYIKKLVGIRKQYKDALVYGSQVYQPKTQDRDVAAYVYRGSVKTVITIANTNAWAPYYGTVQLKPQDGGKKWKDLISGAMYASGGSTLTVAIPPGGLAVLVKDSFSLIKPKP